MTFIKHVLCECVASFQLQLNKVRSINHYRMLHVATKSFKWTLCLHLFIAPFYLLMGTVTFPTSCVHLCYPIICIFLCWVFRADIGGFLEDLTSYSIHYTFFNEKKLLVGSVLAKIITGCRIWPIAKDCNIWISYIHLYHIDAGS